MIPPAHNFRTYSMTLRTQAVLEVTGAPTMRAPESAAANGISRADQTVPLVKDTDMATARTCPCCAFAASTYPLPVNDDIPAGMPADVLADISDDYGFDIFAVIVAPDRINGHLDVSPSRWAQLRSEVMERDGLECWYCGAAGVPLQLDHRIPISRGGISVAKNLVPACKPCNCRKGSKMPWEFSY